jgi:oligopeptide/dipeptide ABC transporter ATP-binding protein
MLGGEIVELATSDDLYERPAHPYTKKLLESFPSLTGERGSFIRTGESIEAVSIESGSVESGSIESGGGL